MRQVVPSPKSLAGKQITGSFTSIYAIGSIYGYYTLLKIVVIVV
jgi:hypothetical protein